MAQHVVLVNQFRPYTTWLGYNWIDPAGFAGLPVIVGFLIAAVHAVSRRRGRTMTANGRLALALLIFRHFKLERHDAWRNGATVALLYAAAGHHGRQLV